MIELIQFPWSPFCIVQRRILEFASRPFKITNTSNTDRSLVWKLTRERYYGVPILRDGKTVIFEVSDDSQVLAKYVDSKLQLGLFPLRWEGLQDLLWHHIENEIEGPCFKLNDIYWQEFVPADEHLPFLRHKERKFGRGCIDQWKSGQKQLQAELAQKLIPFEEMLQHRSFLLEDRPLFVDFNLFGMLENFLFSGHYRLPRSHSNIVRWHREMSLVTIKDLPGEELHS